MKEKIHTIPIHEAFESTDECPFCYMERDAQRRAIRFFAGPSASYMEPGIRELTNEKGFCRRHMKALYDYGNPLGSALMVQTHYARLLEELQRQTENYEIPKKKPLFRRKKQEHTAKPYWQILQERLSSCAICDQADDSMDRAYRVFFDLVREEEFRRSVAACKGFCLCHFSRLLREAEDHLPENQKEWFYPTVYKVMESNMVRVKEDLDWFVAKHDYRNAGADWRNSLDALPRSMQKIQGTNPSDPPHRKD